ncbi:FxLYD domain-containing protein [Thermococcus sp. GR4]|uniref:FxLYD domain-containing protein n=1 Tax=Thermococcus sp. GR4 TaxID=1638254 RepID=UPI001431052A|nr:FxLYD domain-containing protein [Thermococcus sp. GR4]NJE79432.1 hypothetical protein [Thermococcus sp. GR4]
MNRALIVLAIVFMTLAAGCASDTTYSQSGTATVATCPVKILSHEMKVDEFGNYYIEGIAQNVGDKRLSYVEIRARFYDADDTIVGSFLANTLDFDPGQKWKFKIYYLGSENPAKYDIGIGSCW